jgi:hypothetical protein
VPARIAPVSFAFAATGDRNQTTSFDMSSWLFGSAAPTADQDYKRQEKVSVSILLLTQQTISSLSLSLSLSLSHWPPTVLCGEKVVELVWSGLSPGMLPMHRLPNWL